MLKLKFVYIIFPVLVIYHARFVKGDFAGTCWGPIIGIKPEHTESKSLLEHELIHSRQIVRMLFIFHYVLYKYSRVYRMKAEIEAYHAQVKERNYSKYIVRWVIKTLFNKYDLKMPKDEIEDEVCAYYEKKKGGEILI